MAHILSYAALASCTQGFLVVAENRALWGLLGAHTLTLAHPPGPRRLQTTGAARRAAGLHTTHLLSDSLCAL